MTTILSPADYKLEVASLVSVWGNATKVPLDQMFDLSERLRAFYVLQLPECTSPAAQVYALKQHNVRASIFEGIESAIPEVKKRSKHADKNKALTSWCQENVGKIVKVDELAESCGVSPSKARNFISARVDIFSKVGRGLFLVKDPKAEREAEKNK